MHVHVTGRQISTIGELGVLFILFTLGLEFSISKLQEVWRVAVIYGSMMYGNFDIILGPFLAHSRLQPPPP